MRLDAGQRPRWLGGSRRGHRRARCGEYRLRVASGRLITIEGLDGAGKSTLAEALAARPRGARARGGAAARARRRRASPSASARSSTTRRSTVSRARRGAALRRRARPARAASSSSRCSPRARSCCSTASSTPRWPTRAPGAGSGWRRCARSTAFATAGLQPDRTLLLRVEPRHRARASERPRRGPGPAGARRRGLLRARRRRLRAARARGARAHSHDRRRQRAGAGARRLLSRYRRPLRPCGRVPQSARRSSIGSVTLPGKRRRGARQRSGGRRFRGRRRRPGGRTRLRHAFQEASFHISATWAELADWIETRALSASGRSLRGRPLPRRNRDKTGAFAPFVLRSR